MERGRNYWYGVDNPAAGSGGILASSEVACCRRSYARSTSVILPARPTAKPQVVVREPLADKVLEAGVAAGEHRNDRPRRR